MLLVSLAIALASNYVFSVELPHVPTRLDAHQSILDGTAPSPYRYRVLAPLAAETIANLVSIGIEPQAAFITSYALIDFTSLLLFFMGMYRLLRQWYSTESALIGCLIVGSFIGTTFRHHFFQPWSLVEAALFVWTMVRIVEERYWAVPWLAVLATLNRETGIFLAMLGFGAIRTMVLHKRFDKTRFLPFVLAVVLSVAILISLRVYLGEALHVRSVYQNLVLNLILGNLVVAGLQTLVFLGAFWALVWRGARRTPVALRQFIFSFLMYGMAIVLFGVWKESRMLLPFYPLFIAMGLAAVEAPRLEPSFSPIPQVSAESTSSPV